MRASVYNVTTTLIIPRIMVLPTEVKIHKVERRREIPTILPKCSQELEISRTFDKTEQRGRSVIILLLDRYFVLDIQDEQDRVVQGGSFLS